MATRILAALLLLATGAGLTVAQEWQGQDSLARIDGYAIDFDGRPWAGYTICFAGSERSYCTESDTSGYFAALLPKGDTYLIQFIYLGMEEDYSKIEVPSGEGIVSATITLKYKPAEKFTLRDVHFDTGKASLKPTSYPKLKEIAAALVANANIRLEISGHTDNVGSEESNQKLSQARAESVVSYLVQQGIEPARLEAVGYGESKPVTANDTPEGRAQNRRTEARILQ